MEVEATIPAIVIVIVAEIISGMTGFPMIEVTDETIETVTGIEAVETTEIIGITAHNPIEDNIKVEAIIKNRLNRLKKGVSLKTNPFSLYVHCAQIYVFSKAKKKKTLKEKFNRPSPFFKST